MKSLFEGSQFIFAAAQTLGMLVSYFLVLRYLNDVVVPEWLPILLGITFVSGFLCTIIKKKATVWSDLLTSFLAYNLATYAYLATSTFRVEARQGILSDFFNMAVFMALGYPVVLKALTPAVLTSVGVLFLYRRLRKQ